MDFYVFGVNFYGLVWIVGGAEADAEAAQLVAEAISKFGTGLLALRKIEAAQFMV